MDRWGKLYDKIDRVKRRERNQEARAQLDADALRAFEDWCNRVTAEVMEAIHVNALERARDFERKTRCIVHVNYPVSAPSAHLATVAPEMSFMTLELDRAIVHVYSARSPGKLPSFHSVTTAEQLRPAPESLRRPKKQKRIVDQRLVSTPLCKVSRTQTGTRWDLRTPSRQRADIDVIVYRLFDELVKQWRRHLKQEEKAHR